MVKFQLDIYRPDMAKDNIENISITRDTLPELALRGQHAGIAPDEDVILRYWIYTGSRTHFGEPYTPYIAKDWHMKFHDVLELAFG